MSCQVVGIVIFRLVFSDSFKVSLGNKKKDQQKKEEGDRATGKSGGVSSKYQAT